MMLNEPSKPTRQLLSHSGLPGHRRPPKPLLDEQAWRSIDRALSASLIERRTVRIALYHPYEDCAVIGIVDRIDPLTHTFNVDGEPFKVTDIIGVEVI